MSQNQGTNDMYKSPQSINDMQESPEISRSESQDELRQGAKVSDQNQLVPVTEAIKYRKRAQAAEQNVEQLSRQLKQREEEQKDIQVRLEDALLEHQLTQALVKAGVVDIEVALLLAKQRVSEGDGEPEDMNRLIEKLRSERPYLFCDPLDEVVSTLAGPTTGAQKRGGRGISVLSRLAQQASESGSRKDMQEYLRLRRSVRR